MEKTIVDKLKEIFKDKSYGEIEITLESFLRNIKFECGLNCKKEKE